MVVRGVRRRSSKAGGICCSLPTKLEAAGTAAQVCMEDMLGRHIDCTYETPGARQQDELGAAWAEIDSGRVHTEAATQWMAAGRVRTGGGAVRRTEGCAVRT